MNVILLCTVMAAVTLGDFGSAVKPNLSQSKDETDVDNSFDKSDIMDELLGGKTNLKDLLKNGGKYGDDGHDRKKSKSTGSEDETGSGGDLMDLLGDMFDAPREMKEVRTSELKILLGQMSNLVKEIDNPLAALKSELVDKMSQIKDNQDLSRFLKDVSTREKLPSMAFSQTVKMMTGIMMRLIETGYETDPQCVDMQRRIDDDIPKSGKLPESFRPTFLSTYLMSVSCLSRDNALFHKDLAMLQELHENSDRDEVTAAVGKVMIGCLRLLKAMMQQEEAVQEAISKLPEPGLPRDTVIYKRLTDD